MCAMLFATRNVSNDRGYFACGRTRLCSLGTVSTLWLKTSGPASTTACTHSGRA